LRSVERPADRGAELVDDDREALAVRAAHDVVDEVGGIVDACCSTGIVAPGGSSRRVPGRQSMKYSPISDCGRTRRTVGAQRAEAVLVISKSTSARLRARSRRMPVILPARTPATFTSAPSTMPNALSSSTVNSVAGVSRRRRRPREARRGRRREQQGDGEAGASLARERWLGSQSKSPDGLNGFEPSSAWCSAAPGQRLRWSSSAPA
jgi:hypothetical protein